MHKDIQHDVCVTSSSEKYLEETRLVTSRADLKIRKVNVINGWRRHRLELQAKIIHAGERKERWHGVES